MHDYQHQTPLLIYDGDCAFCRLWIERWKTLTGERVEYAPYQETADLFPAIPKEDFKTSVQFIVSDGSVFKGAHAVCRTLQYAPMLRWLLWMYEHVPGISAAAGSVYRFVASHRNGLYKLSRLFFREK